jgi:inorganic pyrophosphatase
MQYGKQWLKKVPKIVDLEKPIAAVCEIPAGSRCKYQLDKPTGHLKLGRVMAPDCSYPVDYGFVPRTLASDGMEIDILIMSSEPLLPLTIVECRIIGGFTLATSKEGTEPKLLAAALQDPALGKVHSLEHVDHKLRERIERFFTTYKLVEHIETTFEGWADRPLALSWLEKAIAAAK